MSLTLNTYGGANADFYNQQIGHQLRRYFLTDPDSALALDPQVYERMRKDAVIAFCLRLRKLMSAGTDWYLEAASPREEDRKLLKVMEDLLKHLENFSAARFNLSEAIIAGSRWAKMEGEYRTIDIHNFGRMRWWVCTNLRDMDKRRFRQFKVEKGVTTREVDIRNPDGTLTKASQQIQDIEWVWQIKRPAQIDKPYEDIMRDEYVRHVYDDREDNLGYGGGLASELYTYWYAKEVALQQGLQYLERWAQGILLAKVDTLRDGQASSPTSAARMTEWVNVLEKLRSRHVIVYDSKDEVDVKDAPTGGWQAALDCIDYLDGALKVCILGATLPTSSHASGGSYAMAEVQQATTEMISRFDREGLQESLRRDLLGRLWSMNYENLCKLGLEKAILPYLRIREDRKDDHQIRADVLLKVRQAGMDIRRDEAYSQTGFTPPAIGDEILKPLNETESEKQAGIPKSGGGWPDDIHNQQKETIDKMLDERNALRPTNKKGPEKSLDQKAIDSQTRGF